MPVQIHRRPTSRPARLFAAIVLGGLLLVPAALPVAAKEFLNARLEAPISFDSPPGAELLIGVIVTVPEGLEQHPVDGSPIWLRLTGPTGDVTEAPGVMGKEMGRYEVRIKVPDGGPRQLEVLIRGGGDIPIFLEADPFTFRPVGQGTAQLAPARVAITPAPAVTKPVVVAEPAVEPVADPAANPVSSPAPAPWLAVALALVAGVAVVGGLALILRRARGAAPAARPVDAPPRSPGA